MTDKSDGPGKGPGKPGADAPGPKKPAAIIDLKATEVKPPGAPDKTTGAQPRSEPGAGPRAAAAAGATAKPAESSPDKATPPPDQAFTKSAQTAGAAKSPGPAAPRSTPGFGSLASHLAMGIVGGASALFIAGAIVPQLGLWEHQSAETPGELRQRLATIENAVNQRPALPPEVVQKLAAVEARLTVVDDLGKTILRLGEAQAALQRDTKAAEEKLGKLAGSGEGSGRVAKLEEALATLSAAAGTDPQRGRIPQLAAITGKIADLESALTTQVATVRKSVGEEIETRLAQSAEASEAARSGTQRIDRELSGAKADTARLVQRMEALKADGDRIGNGLRALQEEAGGLRSAVDGVKAEMAAQLKNVARPQDVSGAVAPVSAKLAALEQALQGVVSSEQDRRASAERIVLALELGHLKRALERGGPFAAELDEVRKLAGTRLDLSVLERLKDQGLPTVADLTREFRTVAHQIIDADREPGEASVLDRLVASAKSIVRVRKISHDADDRSVEAIVARMEAALVDSRLSDAIGEAKKLPPKALAAAERWLVRLEGRAAVERALAQLEEQLKMSLGAASKPERVTR